MALLSQFSVMPFVAVLLPVFLLVFATALLLVLLSYSPWAQSRFKWITSIGFYLLIGGLLGISLMGVSICIAFALSPLVDVNLP